MNYLKKFLKNFVDYFRKSTPPDNLDSIEASHPLARALKSKGHFSTKKNIVKERAFLPNYNEELQILETSTYRIDGLTNEQTWNHLKDNILKNPGDKFYGRADISVSDIHESQLKIKEDATPPRHVGIIGWPVDDKDAIKARAMELASKATLHINKIEL